MNPDECGFFRHIPKPRSSIALDLVKGLEQRGINNVKDNPKGLEVYAEDEFVRKECYDEMRCEMPGQPRSTFLMVFSPDGTKVASTHGNHNIYVTDLKSGKNVKTLIGHPRTPWCIAFHPTSNQIIASGCLGGEVRIWDLSGGSEVWTTINQSVIASIAFHPTDRVLVIATYNELYFWDWSKPEPFVQISTSNFKEKLRYVAFDKLGHKLITGIANSPPTRWERVKAPVPVPRQAERSASPYRLRITPRLVNDSDNNAVTNLRPDLSPASTSSVRDLYSNVPERERRITASYRNLLREYEQLVQRYLKVYRPPRMIDVGTDPMEANAAITSNSPQPSTSNENQDGGGLVTPSLILAMRSGRKHKSSDNSTESTREKRPKNDNTSSTESATQTHNPQASTSWAEIDEAGPSTSSTNEPSTSGLLSNIRPIAEEMRNRLVPIIKSLPACDRPKLIRRFENNRQERMRFRQMCPPTAKKTNRRPVIDTSSDSSSSDDTQQAAQSDSSTATVTANNSQTNINDVKNFVMQLEQLLMTVLLAEVDGNDETSQNDPQNEPSSSAFRVTSPVATTRFEHPIRPSSSRPLFTQLLQPFLHSTTSTTTTTTNTSSSRSNAQVFTRSLYPRRRSTSRLSAFIPTRVNYNRATSSRYRRMSYRIGSRLPTANSGSFVLDELVNYAERTNSEDEPPNLTSSTSNGSHSDDLNSVVEDLETSLNDVRSIRANIRPGETSDMLSSFSESLENIMNQSDTILRNLNGSSATANRSDPNFYVRDRNVAESDHNYPRNNATDDTAAGGNMTPLMTSLHLTISYIQRQARLLRQQVESIERIDRAMFEVEQLQWIRQLILEQLRYVRSIGGEHRSSGLTSVRQMMAGTRISDSEEAAPAAVQPDAATQRTRTSGRKTYPPSRLFRLQRHYRRPNAVNLTNLFPRRYERGQTPARSQPSSRADGRRPVTFIAITTVSLATFQRRLENLLSEHTRLLARSTSDNMATGSRPVEPNSNECLEQIIPVRLQDCMQRMNRLLGAAADPNRVITRYDSQVTRDGSVRSVARHYLSTIMDALSTHLDDNNGAISQHLRGQIVNVLAMALLLSDLLLLQLVDSIPPPAGMNLDLERESLTSRIDQMCSQMLQNRFSSHSLQLTRNLQHMRLIMRHAYRALGQTYNARRNAILPTRQESNRRQLLNRYLRNMNRRRPVPGSAANGGEGETRWSGWLQDFLLRYSSPTGEDDSATNTEPLSNSRVDNLSSDNDDESEFYLNNNSRNVTLYRTNNVNLVTTTTASTIGVATATTTMTMTSTTSPVAPSPSTASTYRPWNVPSVQLNDVPISEQASVFHQRILSHRHRLAERVSELRSLPQMSVLRPRFLHPLYASVNPFDGDLDDPQRETNYDCDLISTPNYRIQMWDISSGHIPNITNPQKNLIVSECKIHNDASVDIAKDGTILVTLLPSGGYLGVTNKLGVYSMKWSTLGQCLYTTSFEQNAVSVALSPLSRHLVVGLASRRVSIVPSDRWTMARIFIIEEKDKPGDHLPIIRELGQSRDSRATNYKSVNCIRWLPTSGEGLIYATNTGQLVILT